MTAAVRRPQPAGRLGGRRRAEERLCRCGRWPAARRPVQCGSLTVPRKPSSPIPASSSSPIHAPLLLPNPPPPRAYFCSPLRRQRCSSSLTLLVCPPALLPTSSAAAAGVWSERAADAGCADGEGGGRFLDASEAGLGAPPRTWHREEQGRCVELQEAMLAAGHGDGDVGAHAASSPLACAPPPYTHTRSGLPAAKRFRQSRPPGEGGGPGAAPPARCCHLTSSPMNRPSRRHHMGNEVCISSNEAAVSCISHSSPATKLHSSGCPETKRPITHGNCRIPLQV